ncbi:Nucleotide-binding universal stress protein, UspA family [Halobiforma haloterrestris]|uniref:Nucleotide-binding universal stress protein, UspA family n=1 Tax=Natronobacterium haloterrestre TaxID=148448 RepID=A0A1I1KRJ8_NATHA|nr:universal stress protein [Halobiforma haloterrestris]SFC61318.1 Nucleotide-binding universal stress protein, UspA family [Halobiforma haloterrestris]
MSDSILVPYDGSAPSKDALEYAFEKFPDADVTALYVVPAPEGYWGAFDDTTEVTPDDEAQDRGQTILDEAAQRAAEHDREIETEVATGEPDREIVEFAEDHGADTIVIGSHGREGVSRVLLGSVAETVVRRSPIPVAVVR